MLPDTGKNAQIATGTFSLVSGSATVVSGVAATAQAFGAVSSVASTASAVSGPINILALAATIGTVEGARVFGNIDAQQELNTLIGDQKKPLSMDEFVKTIRDTNGQGSALILTAISKPPLPKKPIVPYEIWLGSGPVCEVSPDDCKKIGLNYKGKDNSGDGNPCTFGGYKVLCSTD